MNGPPGTVFVIDDDSSVRTAIQRLVRSASFEVKTFASAREFLRSPHPDTPGCLVLDVRLPDLSGLDLQKELLRAEVSIPIVFMTGHRDVPTSVQAMKAGAVEFLVKPFRDQDLLDAIEHGIEVHRRIRQQHSELAELRKRYERLTPRERDVFPLVTDGLLNKQIAEHLGASEKTIKIHRGQVMRKMRANSLADLVRMAQRMELHSH
jgi:FixJ family two-component response regulator